MVSLVAAGMFLGAGRLRYLLGSNPDIAAERERVTELKEDAATESIKNEQKSETNQAKTEEYAAAKVQMAASETKQAGVAAEKQQDQGNQISKHHSELPKPATAPKPVSDVCESPLFFKLEEPFSILNSGKEQAPLHLTDPKFQLKSMELLGVDQTLRCETKSEPPRIVVSVITNTKSTEGGPAGKPLASFEASGGKTIRFAWSKDQSVGDGQEGHSASRPRLRSQIGSNGRGN